MEYTRNEIIDTIDSIGGIESIVLESVIDVYTALSTEYEKALTILDHYEGDDTSAFSIFQEASIIDKATGKNTGDSVIKKILLFVPRLLGAIVSAIASVFTKDYDKDIDTSVKRAEYAVSNSSNAQLTQIAKNVDSQTEGAVKFDPNKKEFKFGKKFCGMINKITLISSASTILVRIRQECKSPNTPYKKFAEEIKALFNGDKETDETTLTLGLNALTKLLHDGCEAGYLVSSSTKELSNHLQNKIKKDYADGKNVQKAMEAKELIDQIHEVSKTVANVTLFGRLGKKVIDVLGHDVSPAMLLPGKAGKNARAKARNGSENLASKIMQRTLHSGDYDEIDDLEFQNTDLEKNIRGTEKQRKVEEELHEKKQDLRADKKRLKKEAKKSDRKLQDSRDIRVDEDLEYELTGNVRGRK